VSLAGQREGVGQLGTISLQPRRPRCLAVTDRLRDVRGILERAIEFCLGPVTVSDQDLPKRLGVPILQCVQLGQCRLPGLITRGPRLRVGRLLMGRRLRAAVSSGLLLLLRVRAAGHAGSHDHRARTCQGGRSHPASRRFLSAHGHRLFLRWIKMARLRSPVGSQCAMTQITRVIRGSG
jgi:hypothetical protein